MRMIRKKMKNDVGQMKREKVKEDLRVEIASCERALTVFGIEEVKKGTGNFSIKNRIKGSVYSGEFGGKVLAVKKMSRDIDISQEVNILMRINHFNVIKLHGVCDDLQSFYLVSEYMEFGCLKDWLRRDHNMKRIGKKEEEIGGKWETRVKIGLDVANGLHYLHNFTEPAYVHQDIKSSNVLLNSDLRAKITNFSLAKSYAARDATNTVHLVGTRGYMAPEYVETGEVTPKVDVYAFGVVLLELITGKEAVLGLGTGKETLLSTTMISLMEKRGLESNLGLYFDPRLGEFGMQMGLPLFRLSLACLRREAECRPTMEEVVSSLVRILTDFKRSKPLSDESITDQSVPLRRGSACENDWSVENASW
ncbi:Protein LYK5 [Linum perenne]